MQKVSFLAFVLAATWSVPALAAPPLLPVQGRLLDSGTGLPIDGPEVVDFRIYAAPAGGGAFFEETQPIEFSDGYFVAYIGETKTLPASLFDGAPELWLGVKVGTDSEMTPRVQLGAAPSAAFANSCGNATTLGDLSPSDFARMSHAHSGYAGASHLHAGVYALTSHPHTGYADTSHGHTGYADDSHLHVGVYALTSHPHTGYADAIHGHTGYAGASHLHVGVYALTSHPHTGYADAIHGHSVSSSDIVNGTIVNADLANNAVNSAKVADNSLTASDLAPNSVGTSEIANGAVANVDLGISISQVPPSGSWVISSNGQVCSTTTVAKFCALGFMQIRGAGRNTCYVDMVSVGSWRVCAIGDAASGNDALCNMFCF